MNSITNVSKSGTSTTTVARKQKRESSVGILYLSGASTCESDDDAVSELCSTEMERPVASSSEVKLSMAPVFINGKLVVNAAKPYRCTFSGCTKSYKKPARLEEHERTHTGERPFVCSTCQKTYLRDTHLQAHMRSHLPESSRSFACTHDGCGKKFWTSQHLKRHESIHSGEKPFKCTETDCSQSFAKHHQLRSHVAAVHCPPGTKIFRCEHQGCTKSFSTSQKLKAHITTHEERRYTCSHGACLRKEVQEYFSTWTALQAHTRNAHPPTCPFSSCKGKTFSHQKGLRAHLKLHEQRDIEDAWEAAAEADDEGYVRSVKRRRGGELGRNWNCSEEGCEKDFKSKSTLETHVRVAHLQRRDFVCLVEGCRATFGYKHLLQRHTARAHAVSEEFERGALKESRAETPPKQSMPAPSKNVIDALTGKAYADHTKQQLAAGKALACPYPDIPRLGTLKEPLSPPDGLSTPACPFVFSRAYDFRRHLSAAHELKVDRETADVLVEELRRRKEVDHT